MRNKFRILLFILLILEDSSSLKCHKCISFSNCPQLLKNSQIICEDGRRFLEQKLHRIYYNYGLLPIPLCPLPNDPDAWRNIEANPNFITSCPEDSRAHCAVGRFKITSTITEGVNKNKNLTTYGTSLGCLAKVVKSQNQCSFVMENSGGHGGMRHSLEIEHCRTTKEMCQNANFCIGKDATVVKQFREDIVENWKGNVKWILSSVLVLIIIVVLFCLLGIKYDGSEF